METECIGEYVVYIYKPKGNDEYLEGTGRKEIEEIKFDEK